MSQRIKTLLLAVFLVLFGGAIAFVGGLELAGMEAALRHRAPLVAVGRGPAYGLVAGVALLLLGAVILRVDVMGAKAGPGLVRAIGVGLVTALVTLVVLPPVLAGSLESRLQALGYRACGADGRGRWVTGSWAAPGRPCAAERTESTP